MGIIIHILGIIAIIQVVTHFASGNTRASRSSEALFITIPGSIIYLLWLF